MPMYQCMYFVSKQKYKYILVFTCIGISLTGNRVLAATGCRRQAFSCLTKMSLALFHLSVVAVNSYVIWYDQTYVDLPLQNEILKTFPLKSRSIFLTYWCLITQTLYHTIAFVNDVCGSAAPLPKKRPLIRIIKDTLFSLAFPIALYVSTAFWAIYAVDKKLILADHLVKLYPPWMNHVMHTTVALFMFVELLFTSRNFPSRRVGLSITTLFMVVYLTLLLTIYFKTGAWVYPVFEPLNWPFRIVFLVFSFIIILGFYIMVEKLHHITGANTKAQVNDKITEISSKKKQRID